MRSAPSSRMTSPLSISLEMTWQARSANSDGRPSRGGNGIEAASCARASAGRAASSGVSKSPGAIVLTRIPDSVARGGQRHRDDPALGRRVGDLADLPVVGGYRRGVDADAALAGGVGLVGEHGVTCQAQGVERADEVHGDDLLEGLEAVRAAWAGEALGVADPGAVHRDPQPAQGERGGGRDRRLDLVGVGHVRGGEGRALAELGRELRAELGVEIGDQHVRAAREERARRRLTEARRTADDERSCSLNLHEPEPYVVPRATTVAW